MSRPKRHGAPLAPIWIPVLSQARSPVIRRPVRRASFRHHRTSRRIRHRVRYGPPGRLRGSRSTAAGRTWNRAATTVRPPSIHGTIRRDAPAPVTWVTRRETAGRHRRHLGGRGHLGGRHLGGRPHPTGPSEGRLGVCDSRPARKIRGAGDPARAPSRGRVPTSTAWHRGGRRRQERPARAVLRRRPVPAAPGRPVPVPAVLGTRARPRRQAGTFRWRSGSA